MLYRIECRVNVESMTDPFSQDGLDRKLALETR